MKVLITKILFEDEHAQPNEPNLLETHLLHTSNMELFHLAILECVPLQSGSLSRMNFLAVPEF